MANHGVESEVQIVMSGYTVSVLKCATFGATKTYYVMRNVHGDVVRLPKSAAFVELLQVWSEFRRDAILDSDRNECA